MIGRAKVRSVPGSEITFLCAGTRVLLRCLVGCIAALLLVAVEIRAQHPDPGEMVCTDCHSGVMGENAVHEYALEEMCTVCHRYKPEEAKVKPVSEEGPICTSCHVNPGVAAGSYHPGTDGRCAICHSPHGTARQYELRVALGPINHFKTAFPLMGRHNEIPCIQCHPLENSNKSAGEMPPCQDCHEQRHRSDYLECGRCHTSQSWQIQEW